MAENSLPIKIDPRAVERGMADRCNSSDDAAFRKFMGHVDALVSAFTDHMVGVWDCTDIDWWGVYEGIHPTDRTLDTAESQRAVIEALAEGDLLFGHLVELFGIGGSDG